METNQIENIIDFKIVKETEKAINVDIPYWIPTNDYKKKHISKKFNCWIPKSLVKDNVIPLWIVLKAIDSTEKRNPYRKCNIYDSNVDFRRMNIGQQAPTKLKEDYIGIDVDKVQELKEQLIKKYNSTNYDQTFLINPPEDLTEEDGNLAKVLRNPGEYKDLAPKKVYSRYK